MNHNNWPDYKALYAQIYHERQQCEHLLSHANGTSAWFQSILGPADRGPYIAVTSYLLALVGLVPSTCLLLIAATRKRGQNGKVLYFVISALVAIVWGLMTNHGFVAMMTMGGLAVLLALVRVFRWVGGGPASEMSGDGLNDDGGEKSDTYAGASVREAKEIV